MPSSIRRTIILITAAELLERLWWGNFISVLFSRAAGLSVAEIGIQHLITGLVVICLEMPSGVFADRIGHRKSILIGYGGLLVAFFTMEGVASGHLPAGLLLTIVPVALAVRKAFHSGAKTAYVWLLFANGGRSADQYLTFQTRLGLAGRCCTAAATVGGTYLFAMSPLLPYGVQIVEIGLAALCFASAPNIRVERQPARWQHHLRDGFRALWSASGLPAMVVVAAGATVTLDVVAHLVGQPYYLSRGLTVTDIGTIGIVVYLVEGICDWMTAPLWQRCGERITYAVLALFALCVPLALSAAASLPTLCIATGLLYGSGAMAARLLDYSAQIRLPDALRATTMSAGSMLTKGVSQAMVFGAGIATMTTPYSDIIRSFGFGAGAIAIGGMMWITAGRPQIPATDLSTR